VSLTRNDRLSESLLDRVHKDPAGKRIPAQNRCKIRGISADRDHRASRQDSRGWGNDAGMAPACLVT